MAQSLGLRAYGQLAGPGFDIRSLPFAITFLAQVLVRSTGVYFEPLGHQNATQTGCSNTGIVEEQVSPRLSRYHLEYLT